MKKISALLFGAILSLCAISVPVSALDAPLTSAESMILMEASTGRVLGEKGADTPRLIASTTKLMTALLASEAGTPERMTEIRREWTEVEGSSMYLRAGERYTLRELMTGLLLASGNDAALAIAETVCPTVTEFTVRMNDRARELGMGNTHFDNPHGLDGETHRSSARDLATLMRECLARDDLREIMSLSTACVHGQTYANHNKLLHSCPGVTAGKTGYTMAAGRCLVSACEREGMELIAVTLSDPRDWEDHKALYDWGFANFALFRLSPDKSLARIPLVSGERDSAPASPEKEITFCAEKGEKWTMEITTLPFAFAPCVRETVGTARITEKGAVLREFPLVLTAGAADHQY